MRFSYRGVSYEREPLTLEVTEGEIGGKYRGQDWKNHYPRHFPNVQPKLHLQYRGVAYSTRPTIQAEVIPISQRAATGNYSTVPTSNQLETVVDLAAKTHLDSMRRNLEHRLQVAKASGNESLVNLLEKESKQLALNV